MTPSDADKATITITTDNGFWHIIAKGHPDTVRGALRLFMNGRDHRVTKESVADNEAHVEMTVSI